MKVTRDEFFAFLRSETLWKGEDELTLEHTTRGYGTSDEERIHGARSRGAYVAHRVHHKAPLGVCYFVLLPTFNILSALSAARDLRMDAAGRYALKGGTDFNVVPSLPIEPWMTPRQEEDTRRASRDLRMARDAEQLFMTANRLANRFSSIRDDKEGLAAQRDRRQLIRMLETVVRKGADIFVAVGFDVLRRGAECPAVRAFEQIQAFRDMFAPYTGERGDEE